MGGRWKPFGFGLFFILVVGIQVSWSLNDEGLVLVAFRSRIVSDPLGALSNWNPNDAKPCLWSGVHCVDSKVQVLNMTGLLLEGTLAPELGKLRHLKSLVLYNNCFTGEIPKELGGLTALELLDLRDNDFHGKIPSDIGRMLSLRHLLLCNNRFEGSIPLDLGRLNLLSEFEFDDYLDAPGIGCVNRKFGHCIWKNDSDYLNKADSFLSPIKGALMRYLSTLPMPLFNFRKNSQRRLGHGCFHTQPRTLEPHMARDAEELASFPRRKLLDQASNVAAAPAGDVPPTIQVISLPTTRSSGAFPAIPDANKKQPHSTEAPQPSAPPLSHDTSSPVDQTTQSLSSGTSNHTWKYIIIAAGIAIFLIILAVVIFLCRTQAVTTIGPWKTGLSGQLQKAFITGVPKLNRTELETACEDFSNIIDTVNGCTVYKGTLSSGVEIAVASTTVTSIKDWSKSAELAYRKKIDTLSRVNHKNFVNLIGFCEEDEPFSRMMVFEYAPNGSLFEHLHIKELEHLDWNTRVRIIMGTAYCLQYMHHDLNPPVLHSTLGSTSIFLTDDYAAKIAEIGFWGKFNSKKSTEEEENSELPPSVDPETNVYNFGIMLLEIISGKLPSEKEGSLVNWASECLKDKGNIRYMIDPTLKSFKNNELLVICEVIEDCIKPDPRQRPTIKEIISKLREVITISPDQAVPRLSPLWWAELEILSVEAT